LTELNEQCVDRSVSGYYRVNKRGKQGSSTTLAEVHFLDFQESLMVIHIVPACGGWLWWMRGGMI
jgi:hypothetical protein